MPARPAVAATSGGAVNALALVAKHPEQVRTLVAHEPPAAQELPDREPVLAACAEIRQAYQRSGFGPAMAKFIALASYQGPVPAGFAERPAPDPAGFGLLAEGDGSRNDPLAGQNMPSCPRYRHDFGALRAASARVVVAVGAESSAMMVGRRLSPWPGGSARRPSPSPAATMGSPAANTAAPANQTLSLAHAGCCTRVLAVMGVDKRPAGGPRPAGWPGRCPAARARM